jgi:SAM-dependent methyltransferase
MRKFMRFLVRNIPRPLLIRFSGIFTSLVLPFYKGNKVECPVCGSKFSKFLPYGNIGAVNRLCPKCLSLERHRLMWLYLQNETEFFTKNLKVLHIAPEQSFHKRFRKLTNLDYTTADLVSPLADLHFDIMNIPLDDNSFDVVICNHVLEHVPNDIDAMKEIYRILKPDGWAILQVPINSDFETTFEDPSITTPKEREKAFGQYDHVRWHGRDYQSRLESAGFKVNKFSVSEEFEESIIERMRLDRSEVLLINQKVS